MEKMLTHFTWFRRKKWPPLPQCSANWSLSDCQKPVPDPQHWQIEAGKGMINARTSALFWTMSCLICYFSGFFKTALGVPTVFHMIVDHFAIFRHILMTFRSVLITFLRDTELTNHKLKIKGNWILHFTTVLIWTNYCVLLYK